MRNVRNDLRIDYTGQIESYKYQSCRSVLCFKGCKIYLSTNCSTISYPLKTLIASVTLRVHSCDEKNKHSYFIKIEERCSPFETIQTRSNHGDYYYSSGTTMYVTRWSKNTRRVGLWILQMLARVYTLVSRPGFYAENFIVLSNSKRGTRGTMPAGLRFVRGPSR